jgi:glucose-1-phosphate cytidylyltransferase
VLCVGYGAAEITALLLDQLAVRPEEVETGVGWHRFGADGLRFTLVDSGPDAGKSGRLLDARSHLGSRPFLLGYADVLSDFDLGLLIDRHRAAGAMVTLVATRVRSRFGELTVDPTMAVTGFAEKPLRPELISAGYFMCDPELLDLLSPDAELESETLPQMVERGVVHAVLHDGLWLPFDTYKDFLDAETLVAKEGCPWLQPI